MQKMSFFPIINIEYLQTLTVETYQIYLAPSYYQDSSVKLYKEGNDQDIALEIDESTNEHGLIRVPLFSRFSL